MVKNLSVDCLMGADFLVTHKIIIDCGAVKLHLGGTKGHSMQFIPYESSSSNANISVSHTVEVPG